MEKAIRVLHINCNYFGNNTVHKTMIEKMKEIEEIDSYVFCPVIKNITEGISNKIIASNCIKKNDRLFFYNKSKKIRNSLLKTFDINNFDVIHAYTLFTDGNVAYELNKKYNIPYVVAIRNTDVNSFFKYKPYLKRRGLKIMKNASAICFLSESYKNFVYNKYVPKELVNELEEKTYIIANGIDDFWLENKYTERKTINKSDIIRFVYAGRIDANKNIECTQKALELLRNKGYSTKFTIVGKVADKKVFDSIMKYGDTEYLGSMTKEELIKVYRENDIFVMPSHTETFGLVYAEAMSQGLPIIYTKGQGFDGQFEEGLVGYHVNDKNINDIASAIEKIILNYEKLSNNCIIKSNIFKWDNIIGTYYDLYLKICNKQGAF